MLASLAINSNFKKKKGSRWGEVQLTQRYLHWNGEHCWTIHVSHGPFPKETFRTEIRPFPSPFPSEFVVLSWSTLGRWWWHNLLSCAFSISRHGLASWLAAPIPSHQLHCMVDSHRQPDVVNCYRPFLETSASIVLIVLPLARWKDSDNRSRMSRMPKSHRQPLQAIWSLCHVSVSHARVTSKDILCRFFRAAWLAQL